ncbi:MAG TPA: type II secretion system protein [Gammaproteobacteria bacterium]|nr:type II secretion system protein [Gammaproteobacteria bacterium]
MNTGTKHSGAAAGFTLVEMAVVLVIIGLVLGGLLMPLSQQVENEKEKETQAMLVSVREALTGYAMLYGRLPCPDTDVPADGRENTPCPTGTVVVSGRLPWATLGLGQVRDGWYQDVFYAVNGAFTSVATLAAILPDTAAWGGWSGVLTVWDRANCAAGTQLAANVPAVVVSTGKQKDAPLVSNDENENADGDACFVARNFSDAPGAEFNDQLLWLSPTVLFTRLVDAGKLP